MKKLMYLLPVAALAMASCSNSEDVAQSVQSPVQNQELKFFPAIEGNTRGAIETTASISQFYVYASGDLKTSPLKTVETDYTPAWQSVDKIGTVWTPENKIYWALDTEVDPNGPASANFTAYANATGTSEITSTQLKDVTIASDVNNQKDLVVAFNSGKRTDFLTGVPLHFRHALSQIVVNATYANDADESLLTTYPELVVKVKTVKFVNLANKGTLTLPSASTAAGQDYTAAWSGVEGEEDFATAPVSAVTLASAAQFIDQSAANNPLLLMPQKTDPTTDLAVASPTGAYLMVEVDIDYKEPFDRDGDGTEFDAITNLYPKEGYSDNGGYAWIAVPVAIDWKAGYKYTYTLNFSNIAAGYVAPRENAAGATDTADGDPVIEDIRRLVNFLVTVEEAWTDGGTFTPAL